MTFKRRQSVTGMHAIARREHERANTRQSECNRYCPKPIKRPKMIKIAKSRILNAGLGLYLLENVKKGDFVARYNGEFIDKTTNEVCTGNYRIKISSNLCLYDIYLDAESDHHFEDRYQ